MEMASTWRLDCKRSQRRAAFAYLEAFMIRLRTRFRSAATISEARILRISLSPYAYIEFELSFTCEWDPEHGLGVLYQDWQPVEFGGWDL